MVACTKPAGMLTGIARRDAPLACALLGDRKMPHSLGWSPSGFLIGATRDATNDPVCSSLAALHSSFTSSLGLRPYED